MWENVLRHRGSIVGLFGGLEESLRLNHLMLQSRVRRPADGPGRVTTEPVLGSLVRDGAGGDGGRSTGEAQGDLWFAERRGSGGM